MFGHSEREIDEKTEHPKTTIHDTIERFRETDTVTPLPRVGRPPILSDRDKRHLERIVRSNRQQTTIQVRNNFAESSGTSVSLSTIKRPCMKLDIKVGLLQENHLYHQKPTGPITMV